MLLMLLLLLLLFYLYFLVYFKKELFPTVIIKVNYCTGKIMNFFFSPLVSEEFSHKRTASNSSGKDLPRRPAPPIPAGPKPRNVPPKHKPPDKPPGSPKTRAAPDIPTTSKPKLSALAEWHKSNENPDEPG